MGDFNYHDIDWENISAGHEGSLFLNKVMDYFLYQHVRFPTRVENILDLVLTSDLTRSVRKSDYTPALALPKHIAGILDEKCREKEKYREEQIGE